MGIAAVGAVWAQPGRLPPPARPPLPAPAPPAAAAAQTGHETEQETIAKCLADLQSDDVALRRRAVLILGKYDAFPALVAVINSLSDPDTAVRQSALVAMSERPAIPPPARKSLLNLVIDPDIHIRRIASSMLPQLLAGPYAALAAGGGGEGLVLPPQATLADPELELSGILEQALADEDPVVLKNVLGVLRFLPRPPPPRRLAACFGNRDRDVRILAVQAYARLPGPESGRAAALEPLLADPEVLVRREVCRALGRFGAQSVPVLQRLADDPHGMVRLEAVRQLAQQQVPDAFERLAAILVDRDIPVDERADLLPHLAVYGEPAVPLLQTLLEEAEAPLKGRALRLLATFGPAVLPTGELLARLEDTSREVRQAAAGAIGQRRQDLALQEVTDLLQSRFTDVRELAVRLAGSLPREQAADLLLDACLDDDPAIRRQALIHIGMLRPEGWQHILVRSLEDRDPLIQAAAVDALLARQDSAGIQALQQVLQRGCEPALADVIRQRLSRFSPRPLPAQPPQGRRLPHRPPAPR